MDFQPSQNVSRDDEDAVDHARLERLFGRRAQKAATYRRILVTAGSQDMAFGHEAG